MKYLLVVVLTTALLPASFAQDLQVLKTANRKDLPKAKDFAFIEPSTDSTSYEFVATYKMSSKKKKITPSILFTVLEARATKDGANCFKLNSYTENDSTHEVTMVLDTYYWTDSARIRNFANHELNYAYIFGPERSFGEAEKPVNFKIDGEKKTLKAGTYYKILRKPGVEIKITKGGFSGATVWLTLQEDEPNVFFSLTGFGLGTGAVPTGAPVLGFNTGRINKVQGDLGNLLVAIMKPAEE